MEDFITRLSKLGLMEAFQSFIEGDSEFNSYYYKEKEETEDEFFREDIKEDN
jgi:hypothetical protein